jgi:hypothetical protein
MEGATTVAALVAQQITLAGTTPSYTTVTATDTIATPDDRQFLHCKNTNAGADSLVVVVPGTYLGQAIPDVPITVPATTGDKMIGPLNAALVDPATGLITITHTVTTTNTSALMRI